MISKPFENMKYWIFYILTIIIIIIILKSMGISFLYKINYTFNNLGLPVEEERDLNS